MIPYLVQYCRTKIYWIKKNVEASLSSLFHSETYHTKTLFFLYPIHNLTIHTIFILGVRTTYSTSFNQTTMLWKIKRCIEISVWHICVGIIIGRGICYNTFFKLRHWCLKTNAVVVEILLLSFLFKYLF